MMEAGMEPDARYAAALAAETRRYTHVHAVHELPPIFHYWSHTYIHPQLVELGFNSPDHLFEVELRKICAASRAARRFVSLGAGNCDLEVAIAGKLRAEGYRDFVIECVDLNPTMLARGSELAGSTGVSEHIAVVQADLNEWRAGAEYDAVMANQSLHHIVNLEGVLTEAKRALRREGVLIASDMIGRNGHRRWPEALELVYEFWRRLPPSYRLNRQSGYYEEMYQDRDQSCEGFEGVRAQDILPLLLDHFHFRMFFGFANAVDPFLDRGFGPNFDASGKWDRGFIDELHARDRDGIAQGRLTPTHMLAVLSKEPGHCAGNLAPERCVRAAGVVTPEAPIPQSAYDDSAWPQDPGSELAALRSHLAELTALVRRQADSVEGLRADVSWVAEMKTELQRRVVWARSMESQRDESVARADQLERDLAERAEWARRMEALSDERTAWARRLEQESASLRTEFEERTAWARKLDSELATLRAEKDERTAWAQRLDGELLERDRQLAESAAQASRLQADLKDQTERAEQLQATLRSYLRNPLRLFARIGGAAWRRVRGRQSTL